MGTVEKSFGWKLKGQITGLGSLQKFFLECVKLNASCPRLVRTDCGTGKWNFGCYAKLFQTRGQ